MRVHTHTHTLTQESIHRVLSNTKDDLHRKLMSQPYIEPDSPVLVRQKVCTFARICVC